MLVKVCLFVVLATAAMSYLIDEPLKTPEEFWTLYKTTYNRKYDTPEEEARRFGIFKENLARIQEHNKKYDAGETIYKDDISPFADLTDEEFAKMHAPFISTPLNH